MFWGAAMQDHERLGRLCWDNNLERSFPALYQLVPLRAYANTGPLVILARRGIRPAG